MFKNVFILPKKPTSFHLLFRKINCIIGRASSPRGRASSPRENTEYRSHNESLKLDMLS